VLALERLGRTSYAAAWQRQKEVLAARIAGECPDTLILVEHDAVYTVGRKPGARANLLDPGETPVVEVERGGDVTWHGPGQIVAYPIVSLPPGRRDLHKHMWQLEEAAIRTCAESGLRAERDERNTGAWVSGRKIASVGIACRKWVTWHGMALNVDPDLQAFARIHPCGLDAGLITSLAAETARVPDHKTVEEALVGHLQALLG
jgi:lipoyl(octanoyl) transferase